MRELILENLDKPNNLEKLYQENKVDFKREFDLLKPEIKEYKIVEFWNARLNYESPEISLGGNSDLIFVIVASLLAGLISKLPDLVGIDPEFFYQRNIGFIIFPILTLFFIWKNNLRQNKIILIFTLILIGLVYINILPKDLSSDTLALSSIHLPLFLWAVLGFSFVGNKYMNDNSRIEFLKFNGDLAILIAIILIAGMILTGITLGLFSLIGFEIYEFYLDYIVIIGLASSPIVATYIIQTNPNLISKVSPIIAKIFSPLVLITLVVYLLAILSSGKDPYNDREFLLTFNFLLIGVMAIILFSVSETTNNQINNYILLCLSLITIIVNGIALSAIIFRITEWGITPNRLAVLGGNILIMSNLIIITYRLLNTVYRSTDINEVKKSISFFLPIYSIWTIIVTFIFPLIFNFK